MSKQTFESITDLMFLSGNEGKINDQESIMQGGSVYPQAGLQGLL
jgi:hypothetical protein